MNTGGNIFDFNSSSLTDNFSGILALKETLFHLADTNTAALKTMWLKVGQGATVKVGPGQQVIDGLAFDGGTLVFGDIIPGQTTTENTVQEYWIFQVREPYRLQRERPSVTTDQRRILISLFWNRITAIFLFNLCPVTEALSVTVVI